jgi:hypothetical protein
LATASVPKHGLEYNGAVQQMLETEVLGQLTIAQFDSFRSLFDAKLRTPKHMRRLALQMSDFANRTLDTRIRITNGRAEIMQKVGDWDAKTRQEISISLPSDPAVIFSHWQVLDHILVASTVQKNIIQMESYVYNTPAYEVKLIHQSGREDAYSFEVESLDDSCDLTAVCQDLGLEPNLMAKDAAYWDAFNQRVNMRARDLTDTEIRAIIAKYCQ